MMTIDLKPYLAQRSRSCVYAVYTIPVARPAPQERKPGILDRITSAVELLVTAVAGAGVLWVLGAIISVV